ncbi:unnamed protein product [Colletotrichum noveboracense]|uniref:Uncharacterized protein n=1 Tax=Colletotrichum noveboracense TaxID=2664923 RepID=A0A9W4RSQ7_9PEZI|nr:hypothetical protein COL940_000368 [Colletotrichum noveboracense]KAJ0325237.1 hypothetical protein Brms1b_000541 [Colletotrichum noveboracense]CAI0647888.1 unnamed protein product [Colletotrichum noveboracense]
MATTTSPPMPNIGGLLAPILPALPPASISTQPAIGVLPLLSPILRQRVQLLSESSTEPWIRLLAYDTDKAARLSEIVQSGRLEPHPVSGEVEVDWEYDAKTRYRRLDLETLQALVVLEELELSFRLIYCVGDKDGGGDGWRVGDVSVVDKNAPFGDFGGYSTIAEAEKAHADDKASKTSSSKTPAASFDASEADEDEDDGYWDRYDATPARTPANRTPAVKRSPAPHASQASQLGAFRTDSAEDAYYAQYDSVQPAMDAHDPDEEVEGFDVAPPLGLGTVVSQDISEAGLTETNGSWTMAEPPRSPSIHSQDEDRAAVLLHPRPASSASSNGSRMVEKLEETAEKQGANEFGVKQHVSRSLRSLFLLARSSGIDREEFERLVKTELDVLGMIEDEEE